MFFLKKYFFLFSIFIFLTINCQPSNKEESLYPEKNITTKFPYKPKKITIIYHKDSILIYKTFDSHQKIKHTLILKNNQFYFFGKGEKPYQKYLSHSYLFLRNEGPDSCYSIIPTITNSHSSLKTLQGFDLCFSKLRNNNFTTIIRFNGKDTLSYSENYFYTKKYKIYKIALRYKGTLLWYKLKK